MDYRLTALAKNNGAKSFEDLYNLPCLIEDNFGNSCDPSGANHEVKIIYDEYKGVYRQQCKICGAKSGFLAVPK